MIKIAQLENNLYQVDDNELPLENAELRKLLTSYAGLSDIEANQWLDVLDEKKENTFEPKEANKGVVVNIYEVEYPMPQDPNKETQEMAKHLNEYKDFVSQQVFPGSETEDVVVDLRQNLVKPKAPQKLNWSINEENVQDYVGKNIVTITKYRDPSSPFIVVRETVSMEPWVGGNITFEDPLIIAEIEDIDTAIEKGRKYSDDYKIPYIVSDIEKQYKNSQKLNWAVPTKDHQSLMNESYDLWQQNENWDNQSFLENLPSRAHKDAVVLGNLNYQVGNGGFQQWYDNKYGGRDYNYLLILLAEINTPNSLQVKFLVEESYNIHQEVRQAENRQRRGEFETDDEYEESEENLQQIYLQFDDLDSKYYELDDAFMAECEEYLQRLQSNASKKLNWAQLTPMKVLRAIKVGRSWMWTNPNELVIPETLTDDYAFYGLDSRKGSQYAIVTSEEVDPLELAKKDVEGFYGTFPLDKKDFNNLVKEKVRYYSILTKDLQQLPNGTIIEEISNPESGSRWYRIIKTVQGSKKLNWRDVYEPGNPDDFFKADKCDRCGRDISKDARMMSWFNEDTLCMKCISKEQDYKMMHKDSVEGQGLPEELTPQNNWRNRLND